MKFTLVLICLETRSGSGCCTYITSLSSFHVHSMLALASAGMDIAFGRLYGAPNTLAWFTILATPLNWLCLIWNEKIS